MIRRYLLVVVGLSVFAGFLSAAPGLVRAQDTEAEDEAQPAASVSFDFGNPLAQAGMESGAPIFQQTIPMEGAVDPSLYVMGPNDIVTVSIGGAAPVQTLLAISADGHLVLPVGTIPAAGRTLAEVTRQAETLLKNHFQNVPVEVTLARPRSFYVHVTGAVPNPGRYMALPVARVGSVIKKALSQSNKNGRGLSEYYQPSLRYVILEHKDGSTEVLDLLDYYATGDKTQNPYLRDGDVIHVTAYNPQHESVQITGEVAYPGVYEYRPDDTVLDILRLAAGPQALEQLDTVRLTRRLPDGRTTSQMLSIPDMIAGRIEPVKLQPRDVLRVPSIDANAGHASVTGFVNYPGNYTVQEGVTTLEDLVQMAGGFQPEAHVASAVLIREESKMPVPRPNTSSLDFMGRTFLHRSLQGSRRVSINVAHALQSEQDTIHIYNGDHLVVPRDEHSVLVTGAVNQPGYVPFTPGMDVSYYIQQVGGAGTLSTGIYVIKAKNGDWLPADDIDRVRSGDIIFVNRKPVAESPEIQQLALIEKQTRMRTIQTVLAGVSAVTTIITTAIALFDW